MYKIRTADGVEHGPMSVETVRLWIAERQASGQTLAQLEGTNEWKPLSAFPDFAEAFTTPQRPPAVPPRPAPMASAVPPPPRETRTSRMAIWAFILALPPIPFVTCGLSGLAALALGIVSLVKISNSNGRLRGKGLAIAGLCVAGIMMLVMPAFVLPALAQAKAQAQSIACHNHMKELGTALRAYASENNGQLPQAAEWCDAIKDRVRDSGLFVCPADRGAPCSYAFNGALSGAELDKVDPSTVLLVEADGGWNAVTDGTEEKIKPRHRTVNVLEADGSAYRTSPKTPRELRWEP